DGWEVAADALHCLEERTRARGSDWAQGSEGGRGDCSAKEPSLLPFRRRGRKRPVLDDVVVYGVESVAQWGEQFFGQASKEQPPDQVDVAGGGCDDRSPAVGSQPDFGRPPVVGGEAALNQAAAFHSPGVMRQAAALPTDL